MTETKWVWSDDRGGFVLKLILPRLREWKVRWSVFRDGVHGPYDDEDEDRVEADQIVLLGPVDDDGFSRRRTSKPAKAQLAALERLPTDEAALDEAVAGYLLSAATSVIGLNGVTFPEPDDFEEPEQRRRLAHVRTPQGIREIFRFQGLSILHERKAGLAFVRLEFESGLDVEHGLMVVVNGTTPVGIGQLGDDGLGEPVPTSEDELAAAVKEVNERRRILEAAVVDARNGEGIRILTLAALELPPGRKLQISLRIQTPPVTRVERALYPKCQYDVHIDVGGAKATYKDTFTPRQDYLFSGPWPLPLFAPIVKWPKLTPLWETIQVVEVDVAKSRRLGRALGKPRADLVEAATLAWREALAPDRAAARSVDLTRPIPGIQPRVIPDSASSESGCPRGHGPLREWEGKPRCWTCGWPDN